MATQTRRETRTIREWLWLPIEWAHGAALSVAERLNHERWANLVVILGVAIVNLLILSLLLQGADNRAIALSIVILVALLALRYPEVSITAFIVVGTGLFVNAFWYAAPGVGTGQRTILLGLLLIISFQAIVEYLRLPKAQRPRIWTPLTTAVALFCCTTWRMWGIFIYFIITQYQLITHLPFWARTRSQLCATSMGTSSGLACCLSWYFCATGHVRDAC